jgi:hypothetical protein
MVSPLSITHFLTVTPTFFWSQALPYSTREAPSRQVFERYRYHMANEMALPLLAVDTTVSASDTLESVPLLNAVTHPSCSSFIVTFSSPTPTFERSLPSLDLLSHRFALEDFDKTIDGVSSPPATTSMDCLSSGSSSVVTLSIDPEVSGASSVASSAIIDDLKLEQPQSVLLDTEVAKDGTSLSLDQSNVLPSQEPGHKDEFHRSFVLSSAIEDSCELDADTQDASDHRSQDFECNSDNETFDYKGVDWVPEALVIPPTPATEIQVTPSLGPLLESCHDVSFGITPLPFDKMSGSASSPEPIIDTGTASAPEIATRFASDDIRVGLKYKGDGKTTLVTRCASADDVSGTLEPVKTIHGKYVCC